MSGVRRGCLAGRGIFAWVLVPEIFEVVSRHQIPIHPAGQIRFGEVTTLALVDALYLLDARQVGGHGLLALACHELASEHTSIQTVLYVPS